MATNNTPTSSKEAIGGLFWTAASGTALPTSAVIDTYLAGSGDNDYATVVSGFTFTSEVSENGITFSENSESKDFVNMNGDNVYTVSTSRSESAKLKLIDLSESAFKEIYGQSNVETTTGGNLLIHHNNKEMPERVGIMLIAMRDGRRMVRVLPRFKVNERGEETLAVSELFARDVTIKMLANSNGDTVIDYIKNEDSEG